MRISMIFRKSVFRGLLAVVCVLALVPLINCGGECYYDTDCSVLGQVCQGGKCAAATQPSCTQDADCTGGKRCVATKCVSVPPGFEFPSFTKEEPPGEPTPNEVITSDANEPVLDGADGGEKVALPEGADVPPEIPTGTPCTTDGDCKQGESCGLGASGKLECQTIPGNGKLIGETCQVGVEGECRSNLCHPDAYCTITCQADADCPNGACVDVAFGNNTFKVCKKDNENQCLRDGQCREQQVCRIETVNASTSATKCGNEAGNRTLGQACISNNECTHAACINGEYCTQPCGANIDCPKNFECKEFDLEYPSGSNVKTKFRLCLLPTDGVACQTSKDCIRQGYVCSPRVVSGSLELRCQKPTGAGTFGQTCEKDSDCESGYCLPSGTCTIACNANADCPTTGNPSNCFEVDLERTGVKGKLKACLEVRVACKSDADCNAQEVCRDFLDDAGNYDFRCVPRFSSAGNALGNTCMDNSQCQSQYCSGGKCTACSSDADCGTGRRCITSICTASKDLGGDCTKDTDCIGRICFNKRCSQTCTANTDCKVNGFGCTNEELTQQTKMYRGDICTVPQGGLPCFLNADCPSSAEGECRIVEVSGVPSTRCRAAVGAKKLGETCTQDSDCVSGTCLQPDGICTQSCKQDSDCGTGTLRCLERDFTPSGGGTAIPIKVCTPEPCRGGTSCRKGEVCVYRSSGSVGFLRCDTPAAGKKLLGATCTTGADCATNLCQKATGASSGVCAAACRGSASDVCPLQYECEASATGPLGTHLCLPRTDACVKDADCSSGQKCVLTFDQFQRPLRKCGNAIGTTKVGEPCDPNATTSQCESGFCDPRTKRCGLFCDGNSDCPSGGQFLCSTGTFKKGPNQPGPDWELKYCRSILCDSSQDCASNEICNVSLISLQPVKQCTTPIGSQNGATCTIASDCQSGLCHNGACVALCSADRHCQASEYCGDVNLPPNAKSKGCITGNRTVCLGDADCGTGESCQVNFPSSDPVKQCKAPKTNEKDNGQSCDPAKFPPECKSHLCDSVTRKCIATCGLGLGDCKIGSEVCGSFPVLGKNVDACLPPPQSCQKLADCVKGTVCAAVISAGKATALCLRESAAQTKKVGDTCNPNLVYPGECQTRLCHPDLKVCVSPCQQDSDCPSARPRCGKITLSGGVVASACVPSNAPCQHDGDCPASEPICSLGLKSGVLEKTCSAGGPGAATIGASCDPDKSIPGDCINRFCEIGTQTCVKACEVDAHCPQGLVCLETLIEGGRRTKGCVRAIGSTCTDRLDCARPSYCAAEQDTNGVVGRCRIRAGVDFGTTCKPSVRPQGGYNLVGNCRSNICHPSTSSCSALCQNTADCTVGNCKPIQLVGFNTNVCDVSCKKTADCPTGQLCGAYIEPLGGYYPSCVATDTKLKKLGDSCDPDKGQFSECQTGVCSPTTRKCTQVCEQDSNCGTGEICAKSSVLSNNNLRVFADLCVPDTGGCKRDPECYNGFRCRALDRNGKLITQCQARGVGESIEGAACSPTGTNLCWSQICEPKSNQCTIPCDTNADCAQQGVRNTCKAITVTVGTASRSVKVCAQP